MDLLTCGHRSQDKPSQQNDSCNATLGQRCYNTQTIHVLPTQQQQQQQQHATAAAAAVIPVHREKHAPHKLYSQQTKPLLLPPVT